MWWCDVEAGCSPSEDTADDGELSKDYDARISVGRRDYKKCSSRKASSENGLLPPLRFYSGDAREEQCSRITETASPDASADLQDRMHPEVARGVVRRRNESSGKRIIVMKWWLRTV